jgi:hypothetical protein
MEVMSVASFLQVADKLGIAWAIVVAEGIALVAVVSWMLVKMVPRDIYEAQVGKRIESQAETNAVILRTQSEILSTQERLLLVLVGYRSTQAGG